MNAHGKPQPLGGPIVTRPFLVLVAFAGLAFALIVWRFIVGLGAATDLNDGYAWGLWIAFDVVTGSALACGGYAMALLVYIFNKGEYHPLIRPALVSSAFGYSVAGFSVLIDLGRPWLGYKLLYFWHWNLHSVLLEVALCIMTYTVVLWIELSPAFLEKAETSSNPVLQRTGTKGLAIAKKCLPWLIALGMLLPTMHQSSLGSLMLLSGPRLHPLWNTPLLPLLFLTSVLAMGYGAVVVEEVLWARVFGLDRMPSIEMLGNIGFAMVPLLGFYLAVRLIDIAVRGQLGALFSFDLYSIMSLIELAMFGAALVMLSTKERRRHLGNLLRAGMLLLFAAALYRFDVYLVAFRPGAQWSYFPSVSEILITAGLVSGELAGFIVLAKIFPILSGGAAKPLQGAPVLSGGNAD
jgi:Ni/Fe-hydrogenase subunit HybB-like protein